MRYLLLQVCNLCIFRLELLLERLVLRLQLVNVDASGGAEVVAHETAGERTDAKQRDESM